MSWEANTPRVAPGQQNWTPDGSHVRAPVPARQPGPYEATLAATRERAELLARQRSVRKRRRLVIVAAASAALVATSVALGVRFLRPEPGAGQAGTAPVVQTTDVAAAGCKRPAGLKVVVSPAIATTFTDLLEAFQQQPGVPCAGFKVIPQEPSVVAQGLAGPSRPDAWVTDASTWLAQANSRAGLGLAADAPFATSQIVVAGRPAVTDPYESLGWEDLATGDAELVLPDPTTSTTGLFSLVAAGPHWSSTEYGEAATRSRSLAARGSLLQVVSSPEHNALTPVAEAELAAYNATNPSAPLHALRPADGTAALEYSLVAVADGTVASRVLRSLRDFLATEAAGEILRHHGFAVPGAQPTTATTAATTGSTTGSTATATTPAAGGSAASSVRGALRTNAAPDAAAIEAARQEWSTFAPAPQAVLALDVSSASLSRFGGGPAIDTFQSGTQSALAQLPDRSTVALWVYAQHLGDKGADHRALTGSAPLTQPAQVQALAKGLGTLRSSAGGGRGLYDAVVAAHAAAAARAEPGRPNTAVIVTAGGNDDDYGASLGAAKAALGRTADPAMHVRLVIIGVGTQPDAAVLTQLAKSAGGTYVSVKAPDDLDDAIVDAITARP